MKYLSLDEIAEEINGEREEQEDSYADAARRVQRRREAEADEGEDIKEVHRSHVYKALNGDRKTKYIRVMGELAEIYVPEMAIDLSIAYYPTHTAD